MTSRSHYHGGKNARDWRKKISRLARRTKETVFTYKFPLDTSDTAIDFAKSVEAYGIAEGVSRGSLIGLVCAFHLSGFRLFSKGGEAKAFRNSARYPNQAFTEKLSEILGVALPTLTPESLDLLFQSPPRSKAGVAPAWSQDDLRNRLYTDWTKRGPQNNPDEHLLDIAHEIAKRVYPHFDGWSELAQDPSKALKSADDYFQSQGAFPSFASLPEESPLTPANSTVDFEGGWVEVDPDDDTLLHQAIARCAARLQRERPDLEIDKGPFLTALQDALVSSQNNGLSWLFGVGFLHWKDASVEALAQEYHVPSDQIDALQQVKDFVDAIPVNPFFDAPHYGEFRSSVAGKMRSWIANYWKRLLDLRSLLDTSEIALPESLSDARTNALFSGLLVDPASLIQVAKALPARISFAKDAITQLLGEGSPCPDDIIRVEQVADEIGAFIGQVQQFNNQLEQKLTDLKDDDDDPEFLKSLEIKLPSEFKEPPAINRISGGSPDAEAEVREVEEKLQRVMKARAEHFEAIDHWAKDNGLTLEPIAAMRALEQQRLDDRSMAGDANELALRLLLQRIGRLANRLSASSAEQIRTLLRPVFPNQKEFNLFFFNRMGSLYRSPYSTSRHQPFEIDVAKAQSVNWINAVDDLSHQLEAGFSSAGDNLGEHLRDWVHLSGFVMSNRLRGLPEHVPQALAQLRSPEDVQIPPMLRLLLEQDDVPREVCLKTFNLYVSAINGCLFKALRSGFIVRTRFQRVGTDQLQYVAKDKPWHYPDRLNRASKPIGEALSGSWIKKEGDAIDPVKSLSALSKDGLKGVGIGAYLVQAPHDWYTPIDLRGVTAEVEGIGLEKNITGLKRLNTKSAYRMIGAPSFKSHLDATLTSQEVKLGDFTMIFDQHYEQSVSFDETLKIDFEPTTLRVDAAIPVIDARATSTPPGHHLYDRIVAIDLGEKSIGYAIFDIPKCFESGEVTPLVDSDGNPLVGTIATPSIRRLMKTVRSHRKHRQPNQKVNQSYSTALMNYRENVIGDVCNRIDTLMEKFNAFPVLEFQVKNFQAGAKQLEIVYGSVLHRYTYSGVDAHKAKRKEYWYTADQWDHPYLMAKKWSEETNAMSGTAKPVSIFPGVTVNAARTSQICHQCQRNPMTALQALSGSVEFSDDGELALDDGTIRLFHATTDDKEKIRKARREKQRIDPDILLTGKNRIEYVLSVAKRNLRRPPKSLMSKDTTQSRYCCLYTDCGWTGHADGNAAINIGRRYLAERIDPAASQAKFESQDE